MPTGCAYLALNNERVEHTANIIEPNDVQHLKSNHEAVEEIVDRVYGAYNVVTLVKGTPQNPERNHTRENAVRFSVPCRTAEYTRCRMMSQHAMCLARSIT